MTAYQNIRHELQPFIGALWQTDSTASPPRWSHMRAMPTGAMHIAFRLTDSPSIRIFESENDEQFFDGGFAVVNGFRSKYYIRASATECTSVGVMLRPEAIPLLFRCHADELAQRHTKLCDIWSGVDLILERLSESSEETRMDVLQQILVERLSDGELHPAIKFALGELNRGSKTIGEIVRQTGYSHRGFNQLFRRSIGVNPKTFTNVQRFQRLLSLMSDSAAPLAVIAHQVGYSDQAHMTREFRRFSGISPSEYQQRDRPNAFTVPV